MTWDGDVARMKEKKNAFKILMVARSKKTTRKTYKWEGI
jgi:hypothetical protein